MARRRLNYRGREVDGEIVPFSIVKDGSVLIEAEDGAKLRLKPLILNVYRTGEKNEVGEPLYLVQAMTQVTLEEMAKEEEKP